MSSSVIGAGRRKALSLVLAGAMLAGCASPIGYIGAPVSEATGVPTYTSYSALSPLPPTLYGDTETAQASPTQVIVSPTPFPSSTPTPTLEILVTPTPEIPEHPPNAANLAGKTIVFYGDSITIWGSPRPNGNNFGYSYGMYLQNYLSGIAEVRILGLGGRATHYGLEHIDEVINEKPDIVALAWGMNDPGGGCLDENHINYGYYSFRENTNAMIERLIAYKGDIDILIPTVTPILGQFPVDLKDFSGPTCDYNAYLEKIVNIQREIAAEQQGMGRNVWLVETRRDFLQEFNHVTSDIYADFVHPNRNGHWVMARTYLEFFGFAPPAERPYE